MEAIAELTNTKIGKNYVNIQEYRNKKKHRQIQDEEKHNISIDSLSEFPPLTGTPRNWCDLVKISAESDNKLSKALEHLSLGVSLMR